MSLLVPVWIIYTSKYQSLFVPVSFASSHWVYLLKKRHTLCATYFFKIRRAAGSISMEVIRFAPCNLESSKRMDSSRYLESICIDSAGESGCQASGDRGLPMNLHLPLLWWVKGGRSKLYKNCYPNVMGWKMSERKDFQTATFLI